MRLPIGMPLRLLMTVVGTSILLLALPGGAAAQLGGKKAADERVRKLLDKEELKYVVDRDGDFNLKYNLEEDRSHVVFINSNTNKLGPLDIREVWAPAMHSTEPLDAETANALLIQNQNLKMGGWCLVEGKTQYLLIFVVRIDADADAATLVRAMETVLEAADAKEKDLTGEDEF